MSDTLDIVCDEHRVKLWIGQRGLQRSWSIYTREANKTPDIGDFLGEHVHCKVRFVSAYASEFDKNEAGYADFVLKSAS